jgi:DtxR family transcriptional regulator, Mn-dependent transcriptional regulator
VTYRTPEFHPAFEEYCETIYALAEEDEKVIQARIAERLEVAAPSVSEMVKRLHKEGFVRVNKGAVSLTPTGEELARTVVRRHRLAERFLTDVLGLSWTEAHHEAGKWEHVISPPVEDAMMRVLGQPTTCPHGNPIPGSGYLAPEQTGPMSEAVVGDSFVVDRISEGLETLPGLLEYLESARVLPGRTGTVTAKSPDGTLTVEIEGRAVGLSPFAAERIRVVAA